MFILHVLLLFHLFQVVLTAMKVRGDVLVMMLIIYVAIGISMMNVISPVPLHWLGILRHMTVVSITVPYTDNC